MIKLRLLKSVKTRIIAGCDVLIYSLSIALIVGCQSPKTMKRKDTSGNDKELNYSEYEKFQE